MSLIESPELCRGKTDGDAGMTPNEPPPPPEDPDEGPDDPPPLPPVDPDPPKEDGGKG